MTIWLTVQLGTLSKNCNPQAKFSISNVTISIGNNFTIYKHEMSLNGSYPNAIQFHLCFDIKYHILKWNHVFEIRRWRQSLRKTTTRLSGFTWQWLKITRTGILMDASYYLKIFQQNAIFPVHSFTWLILTNDPCSLQPIVDREAFKI